MKNTRLKIFFLTANVLVWITIFLWFRLAEQTTAQCTPAGVLHCHWDGWLHIDGYSGSEDDFCWNCSGGEIQGVARRADICDDCTLWGLPGTCDGW